MKPTSYGVPGMGAALCVAVMSCGPLSDASVEPVTVLAAANQFVPAVLTIPAGTTVRWEAVFAPHTVETSDGVASSLAAEANEPGGFGDDADGDPDTFRFDLPQGEVVTHRFDVPGTFHYFCRPHARMGMIGTIVVR